MKVQPINFYQNQQQFLLYEILLVYRLQYKYNLPFPCQKLYFSGQIVSKIKKIDFKEYILLNNNHSNPLHSDLK